MTDEKSERAVPGLGPRLVDLPVTVRILAKVLVTMATIAVSGWWFMFDEVRLVRGDVAQQGSELAREIDSSARFQLEQRDRLWNRVDALREQVHGVQIELGDLRARVQQVGQTTDAIFAIVSPAPTVKETRSSPVRPDDGVAR